MNNAQNNKRIAKNTFYLYIRMGITLLVQFYTSRVVLNILGVEDFGLWSVIASLIISFSFISGPLTTATQRFLSFDIGCGGNELNKIFNTSLLLFILIGAVLFLLLETVGVWFLNMHMNIVPEKISVANWVFQFSIFSFVISFIRMPYESAIIAYERMSFYAILCMLEAVLSLGMVYVLLFSEGINKLILYGALIFASKLVITLCYKLYCDKKIICTRFCFFRDRAMIVRIAQFSGWNLFGAMSSVSATQGINVLINMFFGVVVNASYGIASQVGSGIKSFVDNFQKAANPQIVKSYASGDMDYLFRLICVVSKYSFFLLFALACPVMFNMDFLLRLWLGYAIPPHTAVFCNLILVQMLVVSFATPMDTVVFATGKIRNYQITLSIIIYFNIIVTYIFFRKGFDPAVALIVKCFVEFLILIVRILFIRKLIKLSFREYARKTLIPAIGVLCITWGLMFGVCHVIVARNTVEWEKLLVSCAMFLLIYSISLWFIGIGSQERLIIEKWITNKIKTHENKTLF